MIFYKCSCSFVLPFDIRALLLLMLLLLFVIFDISKGQYFVVQCVTMTNDILKIIGGHTPIDYKG